jgi:hypothetical protein
MCQSGSGFALGTHQAPAQGDNLAHPTCPGEAGDVMDAGTVDSVQEEMHGAWAAEGVVGGKVPEDRHWAVAEAVSRSHVIGRSTGSQCPFPVAVRKRGLCLRAR